MERNVKACMACFVLGVINVAVYWVAIFLGFQPDASVACTGMVEMIAPVIGYLVYQAKLKDSRNKYGIDVDGIPFNQKDTGDTDGTAQG